MVYSKYGQIFRALRKQRGLSLIYFEKVGISKSALSMFETGKTMLAFDKLNFALQEMHVSLQFYNLLLNNKESDYFLVKFRKIDLSYYSNNIEELHEIHNELIDSEDSSMYGIALAAKARYAVLSAKEKHYLERLFGSIEIWGRYELYLLLNTLDQINIFQVTKTVFWFLSDEKAYDYLRIIPDFRILFMRIVVMSIFRFCKLGKKDVAYAFYEKAKDISDRLSSELDIANQLFFKFAEGYWIYAFEDQLKGIQIMKRIIRILTDLESTCLRNMLFQYYTLITKDSEK